MKKLFLFMSMTFLAAIIVQVSTPALAEDAGLIPLLTSKLGVTKTQAMGGAGSIFNLAKQNLSVIDFGKVAKAVPGIDSMMAAAPKAKAAAGMLGGASSLLGGSTSSVDKVAGLAGNFTKLGMKADMVNAFTPIILNYVKSKGGEPLMMILQSALK